MAGDEKRNREEINCLLELLSQWPLWWSPVSKRQLGEIEGWGKQTDLDLSSSLSSHLVL